LDVLISISLSCPLCMKALPSLSYGSFFIRNVVVKYMGDTFLDLSCEKLWRFGGAVDTGRAIKGCQTPLLGLMAVCVKGGTGEAEKTGDQSHTKDMRSDRSQDVTFEVIQSGLNLYCSDMETLRVELFIQFHFRLLMSTVTHPFDHYTFTQRKRLRRWSQKAQDRAPAAVSTDRPALPQTPGGEHRPKDANHGHWERRNLIRAL
jgi:hypothetical protein